MAQRRQRWQVGATPERPHGEVGGHEPVSSAQRVASPVQRLWLLLVRLDRAVWRATPSFREGRAAARSWEDAAKLVLQAQMAMSGLTHDLPPLPEENTDITPERLLRTAREVMAELDEADPHGWEEARGLVVEALQASEVATTA